MRIKSIAELPAAAQKRIRGVTGWVSKADPAPSLAGVVAVKMYRSDPHVELLYAQVLALNMAVPVPEYPLVADRKFRLDLAWPEIRVAVEIDGMAHRTRERFLGDREKRNIAAHLGWRMFSVSPAEVRSGEAAKAIAVWLLTTPGGKP